jgi:hypothetical protein
VRVYSRRFATLYELERGEEQVRIKPLALPDLLMHYLLNLASGSQTTARQRVDLELDAIARWRSR